jgi:UDP-N-acetylmuramate--alanine ligase
MKIHFIGIGGVSMSALAQIMTARGHSISGSDLVRSGVTARLEQIGIPVDIGHNADLEGVEKVVRTSAVPDNNAEIVTARQKGIPIVERAEMLGEIASEYKLCIAVSGSHGKTTCSGLISKILLERNPTLHIGGEANFLDGSCRIGGENYFVTEACEYKRNFLTLHPDAAVILNIDADHLDYFRDIDDVKSAFVDFIKNVRRGGAVIINGDSHVTAALAVPAGIKRITFGLDADNDYTAGGFVLDDFGSAFDIIERGTILCRVHPGIRGRHNIYNILAAVAVARLTEASVREIISGVADFYGMDRRYQSVGNVNGAKIIIDYAHHPAEIKTVLAQARETLPKKLIAVFQPHTYSRTLALYGGFVTELSTADVVILAPIYAAREAPIAGVTSELLRDGIEKLNSNVFLDADLSDIADRLKRTAQSGDLILILGAGDIIDVAKLLK